jgi:DNA transposition AAA+ family ATPase
VDNGSLMTVLRVSVRDICPDSAFAIPAPSRYFPSMSTLAEIEQAAKVLPVEQKQRLVASLLACLRKEGFSKVPVDEAAHASLLPLAATAWSQDWDSAEEDEAWRDL